MTTNTPTIKILSFHPFLLEIPVLDEPVTAVSVSFPPIRVKMLDLGKDNVASGQLIADLPVLDVLVKLSQPLHIAEVVDTITSVPDSWEGVWIEVQKYFDASQPLFS